MTAAGADRRLPGWLRVAAGVFIAAGIIAAGVLLATQWDTLGRTRAEAGGFGLRFSPGWLAAALVLATLDLFLMGLIWVRLFQAGGGRIGAAEGIRVWLATNLGRYVPGKVWQLTGLAVYVRYRGTSGAVALTSSLVFQILVLLTGTAVAAVTLGGRVALVAGEAAPDAPARGGWWALAATAALLVLLHPTILRWLTVRAARLLGEDVAAARMGAADLLLSAAGLLLAWGLYGVGFWCILRGLGAGEEIGPLAATGVFAAAYLAGYLAFIVPGGLVVREGAMAGLLVALSPMALGAAAAVAVVARVWTILSELLAAGLAGLSPALRDRGDRDHAGVRRPERGREAGG